MESLLSKQDVRALMLKKRRALSEKRRREAAAALLSLLPHLSGYKRILSFKSFTYEIDTSALNAALGERLALISGPIPDDVDCILVPGVAFDAKGNRLGYGKGYYDRFLPGIKAHTIGIGFVEQQLDHIPTSPHDFPLKAISLF